MVIASKPDLSIIIVNYKSYDLIVDCVRSIHFETNQITYEIIVVDNLSGDDSEALLQKEFPEVVYHQMGYNSGFSRANNQGMRLAKAETFLLLNPDTLIVDKAIQHCYQSFFPETRYGACGVQLIGEDGEPQISGNFFTTGALNALLPLPYWGNFVKWVGLKLNTKITNVRSTQTQVDVDWINGAFIMVRKKVTEKVGLLDEDFFLFSEEIEWCARIKKVTGLCIYGQFNVIHLQGVTTNDAFGSDDKGYYNLYDKKGLQLIVSSFLRIRKQYGVAWMLFHWFNYLFVIPLSLLLAIVLNLFNPRRLVARLILYSGLYKNVVLVSVKYLVRIVAGKPFFYKVL